MNYNLDELRQEILDELAREHVAVFRGRPGVLDDFPCVLWDTENFPDFHDFLNAARSSGARLVVVAHRAFEQEDLEDAEQQANEVALSREDRKTVEAGLRDLRPFVGTTCSLEAAFEYGGHMYVFQVVAPWFEDYLNLTDMMETSAADDEGGPLPGFYSNN